MSSKSDISAGGAMVRLWLKDDMSIKLQKTLKSAGKSVTAFGQGVTKLGVGISAIGTGMLAPIAAGVKAFMDMGGAAVDAAARTGLSVEALSELGFAAAQTGTDMGTVEAAIRRLAKSDLARAGETAEETFNRVAAAIAEIPDPLQRAAAAQKAFGRSGTMLLPMLADMEALRAKASELGIVMSTEDAAAADELGDAWDALKAQGKAIFFQIGAAVAGPLKEFAGRASEAARNAIQWAKDNRTLIVTFAELASAVALTGTAITAFGVITIAAGSSLSGLATIIGVARTAFVTLASSVAVVRTALFALPAATTAVRVATQVLPSVLQGCTNAYLGMAVAVETVKDATIIAAPAVSSFGAVMAFVASPVGIVTVSVAALTAGMVTLGAIFGKTIGITTYFATQFDTLWTALKAITTLLIGGEFAKAWDIAKLAMSAAFSAVGDLIMQWPEMCSYIIGRTARAIVDGISGLVKWTARVTGELFTQLMVAAKSFSPAFLRAMFLGDISSTVKILSSVLAAAMEKTLSVGNAMAAGWNKGEAPTFTPSDRTENLREQLRNAIAAELPSGTSGAIAEAIDPNLPDAIAEAIDLTLPGVIAEAIDPNLPDAIAEAIDPNLPDAIVEAAPSGAIQSGIATYSAAAAQAAGQMGGGGPTDRMVSSMDSMRKTLEKLGVISKEAHISYKEMTKAFDNYMASMMYG